MANKREIPGDRSFVDRQGNVVYPSTENSRFLILQRGESENPGKAYAFFDCDASESYLKEVMQGIVEDSESPKGLELSVQEGISGLKLDENLVKAIQYPDDYRIMTSKKIIKKTLTILKGKFDKENHWLSLFYISSLQDSQIILPSIFVNMS